MEVFGLACETSQIAPSSVHQLMVSNGGGDVPEDFLSSCDQETVVCLVKCVRASLALLKVVTKMVKSMIEYSQDTLVTGTAGCVTWLAKVRKVPL